MLTTSAGFPAGVPSAAYGAIAHCMPAITWASVPLPPGMTRPAISSAPGATPICVPDAFPPAIVPATCVPW